MSRTTYSGLDLCRLSAALMVALYHFGYMAHGVGALSFGWVGVEVFFVISGFVIAFSAEQKSLPEYARSRALRLYPGVWICSTIVAVIASMSLGTYARSMVIFPVGPWAAGSYWTLPIELSFYAVIGIAVWRKSDLDRVALGLGFYSVGFWLAKLALVRVTNLAFLENGFFYLTLMHFGVFFAFGVLIHQRRHPLAAGLFFGVGLLEVTWRSHGLGTPYFLVAPAVWLCFVILILVSANWHGPIKFARTLGLMTYPFYLVHSAIGDAILPHFGIATGIAVTLAVALAVAFLELPAESWLRSLLSSRLTHGERQSSESRQRAPREIADANQRRSGRALRVSA